MAQSSFADLVRAHSWRKAIFTTYALSLTFFEAVVLDELTRAGARQALVLADVDGIRSALSELGAWRVGRDYRVEPVAVVGGVFHPKVTVLTSAEETHLVVGSGNLTFNGWGGNLETLEHLHSGFAADALADAAGFFEALAYGGRVRHEAAEECLGVADDLLRAAIAGPTSTGRIRMLHNLKQPVARQVGDLAAELGGATRIAVASPFWDRGAGIDTLCGALGLDHVYVHAHPDGTVRGAFGLPWPASPRVKVNAVLVEELNGEGTKRPLHAKLFEVLCRRGRILVSGSANATGAALNGANVEACVARLQPEPTVGWRWSSSVALAAPDPGEDEAPRAPPLGILRATLNGDGLVGRVMSGGLEGTVAAAILGAEGSRPLGETQIGADGTFALAAPGLELEGWKGARLVLRLESGGLAAEGFVVQDAVTEISRRAGRIAGRLFAVLSGTDTPADVRAIMAWANDNAERLLQIQSKTGGGAGGDERELEASAILAKLLSVPPPRHQPEAPDTGGEAPANWRRFMEAFLAQFRKPRKAAGGLEPDDDDDALAEAQALERLATTPNDDKEKRGDLDNFDRLFNLLVAGSQGSVDLAHSLTLGVLHTLQPVPEAVRHYLYALVHALAQGPVRDGLRAEAAAALMTALALEADRDADIKRHPTEAAKRARVRAIRMGLDPDGSPPEGMPEEGFRNYLVPHADLGALWGRLREVRTMQEQFRNYLEDLKAGQLAGEYPDLRSDPLVWPTLERAVTSRSGAESLVLVPRGTDACPIHGRRLPSREVESVRLRGIGRTLDCCDRVLVCEEA